MNNSQNQQLTNEELLRQALAAACDTRVLVIEAGARHRAAEEFAALFGDRPAIMVADVNTDAACGRDVVASFQRKGHPMAEPVIFGKDCYAEYAFVERLHAVLRERDAIPVAVGSGTVNDLTKLASHYVQRPYMVVATAASVDGYTAFGASITQHGSKLTFPCPAPAGVLADLEVIDHAPDGMNASGYADMLAKFVAGADWMVAEAAGTETIDPSVWNTVQGRLREWLSGTGTRDLILGLMMSGFAMQASRTSRPASGAEHQFSHLWDMQHHTHNGEAPSHGFKVGIATLAMMALYEDLLKRDSLTLDVDRRVREWPPMAHFEKTIVETMGTGDLGTKALEETRAKYPTPDELRVQLIQLRDAWPALVPRLRRQLPPIEEARAMLRRAGCPTEPEEIGITRQRLRRSYWPAYFLRRRFTSLDLAVRFGWLDSALDNIYGPETADGR